tara:strand:+ start:495 stop:1313 length:819 start_codon:yes stop_codon:yes gene_type:complete
MRKLLFITISILLITSCGSESGCIQGDCQNQISIYVWESGDIYEGGFVDGHFHGQGTSTFSDGSSYVGEYKDGKRNGQGTQTFSDGSSYVGEYKDGEKHGQGTYVYENGHSWTGEWNKNDKGKGYFNTDNYYNPEDIIGEIESTTIRLDKLDNGSDLHYISLLIGDIKEDFIFDTGASEIVVNVDFLNKLKESGVVVKQLNIYGATAELANGQKVPVDYALLNNIHIGDYILNNVVITVSENDEFNLLFGKGALDKFSDWSFSKEGILNIYR